jgi:hypothetical protein
MTYALHQLSPERATHVHENARKTQFSVGLQGHNTKNCRKYVARAMSIHLMIPLSMSHYTCIHNICIIYIYILYVLCIYIVCVCGYTVGPVDNLIIHAYISHTRT